MLGNQIKQTLESLSPSKELITKPLYDHIKLSEEQEIEALRQARENENFRIEREKYWAKINSKMEWETPKPRDFYERLKATKSQSGNHFQINNGNRNVIHALCLYFASDPKFCEYGDNFSLDKGILLLGIPGIGKTHLMNFFNKNPHASYIVPTCKTITEKFTKTNPVWERDGLSVIEYYSSLQKAEFDHVYNQEYLGICFGDLGAESEGSSYGNKRNVIEEIVFNRYESKLPFKYTHFTSNLNPDMIGQKYGDRMRDRLREMCNVLILEGESFRGRMD